MDVPNEEGYIQPTLQLNKYDSDGSQLSLMPTSSLIGYGNMQLWQEPLPQSIFVSKRSYNDELGMSDNIAEEGVDLTAFMDFIFTPGRFAKVAIYDAFKVSQQSARTSQAFGLLIPLFFSLWSSLITYRRSALLQTTWQLWGMKSATLSFQSWVEFNGSLHSLSFHFGSPLFVDMATSCNHHSLLPNSKLSWGLSTRPSWIITNEPLNLLGYSAWSRVGMLSLCIVLVSPWYDVFSQWRKPSWTHPFLITILPGQVGCSALLPSSSRRYISF